jgi:hypothetical protein
MAARRRRMPSNQYSCPRGGHNHVYGSARGARCVTRTSRPKYLCGICNHYHFYGSIRGIKCQTRVPPSPPDLEPDQPAVKHDREMSRDHAKHSLAVDTSTVDTDLLNYVFDRDGFYERLADRLLDNVPWGQSRGREDHVLCMCLNELARGVDPDVYAKLVQKPVRHGLTVLGFPDFVATVLGAGAGIGLKIALGHTPIAHLTSALRVLIALVCPNLNSCPTKPDVINTFANPPLAELLKEMAEGPVGRETSE